jgi:hypothetical protein
VDAVVVLATVYLGPIHSPLYCSTPYAPLVFSPETTPWIALPIEDYLDGSVVCGDLYYIRFSDGSILMARALDAGPFAMYCVRQADGSCPSIALDVPGHLWPVEGISGPVEVYPISKWARAMARYRPSCAGGDAVAAIPPRGNLRCSIINDYAPSPSAQGGG